MLVDLPEITRLDKAILGVFPKYGTRRLKAKAAGYIFSRSGGGHDAGKSDSKEFQEWNPDVDSAITALHPDLYDIRARSRDATRNNPVASGAVDIGARSTVGTGLKVRPLVDHEFLGITDEAAEEWADQAKRVFEEWSQPDGGCDIAMNNSFGELQYLVFRGVFEGGDTLVLDRWVEDRPAPYSSCIHLVEAERICNPDWDEDTEELAGGVEVDPATGMVTAYHITKDHPGHLFFDYEWLRLPAWNEFGQRAARLVYRPQRIGERRGTPWLSAVLKPLKQLDRFTNAELQAAVVSSFFTAFVYDEHPDSDLLGDGIYGDDGPENATALAAGEKGDIRLGPGLINRLGSGEKIEFADPKRPNETYRPFVEMMWQHIGIGLGMPYEVFTMRFQNSYSASKGALAEMEKTVKTSRQWMITHFCKPAYERVISEAIATGRLSAPGFFEDTLKRRAWSNAAWIGDAGPSIDPEKEAKAAKERVELGISTLDDETQKATGKTFKQNIGQRMREAEQMGKVRELDGTNKKEEPKQIGDGGGKDE